VKAKQGKPCLPPSLKVSENDESDFPSESEGKQGLVGMLPRYKDGSVAQFLLSRYGPKWPALWREIAFLDEIQFADEIDIPAVGDPAARAKHTPANASPRRDDAIQQWAITHGPAVFEAVVAAMGTGDVSWFTRMAEAVRLWHRADTKNGDVLRHWLVAVFKSFGPKLLGEKATPSELSAMHDLFEKSTGRKVGLREFRRAVTQCRIPTVEAKRGPKKGTKQVRR